MAKGKKVKIHSISAPSIAAAEGKLDALPEQAAPAKKGARSAMPAEALALFDKMHLEDAGATETAKAVVEKFPDLKLASLKVKYYQKVHANKARDVSTGATSAANRVASSNGSETKESALQRAIRKMVVSILADELPAAVEKAVASMLK